MVQTCKEASHADTELIRRIITFDYEKVLLLMSPQKSWHQILRSLKEKEKRLRHIIYAKANLGRSY